jgi:opacity protein-like surface antigen
MLRIQIPFLVLSLLTAALPAAETAPAPAAAAATFTVPAEAEGSAQDDGGSSFSEAMGRQARLDYSFEAEADLDTAGAFSYWDVTLSSPIYGRKLGRDWIFGARLRYRFSELDWTDQALFDNDSLHRLDLSLTLVYKPENSPWNGFLSAGPGLSGDGSDVNGDDVLYVAIAGVGYKFSERFTLLAGAYFSQDFGEPRLIPAPGFIWQISKKWNISLIPPRLRLAYAPSDNWRIIAEAFPNGGRWSVTTLQGEQAFLDRSGARAGLRIERRVVGNAWLQLSGGMVFARDLVLENDAGQVLFESDAETTPYLSAGFLWRF